MKLFLIAFLLGVIVTLLVFGFNTPLLPRFRILYLIPASWPEFLTAFGTVLTGLVAIAFGLWGKTLSKLFYKSDVKIIDKVENLQTNRYDVTQGQTRLRIANVGESVARDVTVYVNQIKDNGLVRDNFLPVPLCWTHDGRYARDFAPNETWFLDLCRRDNVADNKKPILVLAAGQGIPTYEDIQEGSTILDIKVAHKSGQIRNYQVDLSWKPEQKYVQVVKIKEISAKQSKRGTY